jgi:hypothetical protein
MKFAAWMAVSLSHSFHILLVLFYYHCIYGCMFFMLLFNFVNYVFLLLCMSRSGYSVSLCCSVYCLCVNVNCTAAVLLIVLFDILFLCKCVLYYFHRVSTQLQLTNIYHIISNQIASIVKVSIKAKQFCDVTFYSLVDLYQRLGGTCLSPPQLYLEGDNTFFLSHPTRADT